MLIKNLGIDKNNDFERLHLLNVCKVMDKFNLKNNYKNFYDIYEKYNGARNCLTHRFGIISNVDRTPITMKYPSLYYCMIHNGTINKFNTIENMLDQTKDLSGAREITINVSIKENLYQKGERIIIDDEAISGMSLYLYSKLPDLLLEISDLNKEELNRFFKLHSPFKNKLTVSYEINNEIITNSYPLEYKFPDEIT